MHTQTVYDKSDWGAGPWQNEPDKAQWIDEATGLDCLIVRSKMSGALCGYVGVPESHPAFNKEYGDVNAAVHGGLTFSDLCQENANPDHVAICHEGDVANDRVWWLGFDCAHAWDKMPAHEATMKKYMPDTLIFNDNSDVYRDFEYVVREVTGLAEQLFDLSIDRNTE